MFLLAWLIVGVILITGLILSGRRLANIKATLFRRISIIVVSVVCWPAFVALTSADYFLQYLEGDVETAKEAATRVLKEATIGLYADIREAW